MLMHLGGTAVAGLARGIEDYKNLSVSARTRPRADT